MKYILLLIAVAGILAVAMLKIPAGPSTSLKPQTTSVNLAMAQPTRASRQASGSYRVVLPLVVSPGPAPFYVAPDGTPNGDGSIDHPWDLATALNQPEAVHPGALIWMRGGVYKGEFISQLTGAQASPIVLRQYPHERATIDGSLEIKGAWATYWDFEVMRSTPINDLQLGVTLFGPNIKCINLVVHQIQGSGFGIWQEAPDSEVYGSIIFNNGANRFDHGIYAQNRTGYKLIEDNIIFNQSGYGIHAYTSVGEDDRLNNLMIKGNIIFNNGFSSPYAANLLVGGETPAKGIIIDKNYTYYDEQVHWNVDVGFGDPTNEDLTMTNNYFVGGNWVLQFRDWKQVTMAGNTLIGPNRLIWYPLPTGVTLPHFQWNNNAYVATEVIPPFQIREQGLSFLEWRQLTGFDAASMYTKGRPTGINVFVRPNRYEPGRANIVVYNWDRAATANVDLSGVVRPGAHFEVHNVLDYFGAPVAQGTYGGGTVTLPMVGPQPAQPTASWVLAPASTGPDFNAFVVTSE